MRMGVRARVSLLRVLHLCIRVCMLTSVLLAVIFEGTGVQGGALLTPRTSRGAGYCALFENRHA